MPRELKVFGAKALGTHSAHLHCTRLAQKGSPSPAPSGGLWALCGVLITLVILTACGTEGHPTRPDEVNLKTPPLGLPAPQGPDPLSSKQHSNGGDSETSPSSGGRSQNSSTNPDNSPDADKSAQAGGRGQGADAADKDLADLGTREASEPLEVLRAARASKNKGTTSSPHSAGQVLLRMRLHIEAPLPADSSSLQSTAGATDKASSVVSFDLTRETTRYVSELFAMLERLASGLPLLSSTAVATPPALQLRYRLTPAGAKGTPEEVEAWSQDLRRLARVAARWRAHVNVHFDAQKLTPVEVASILEPLSAGTHSTTTSAVPDENTLPPNAVALQPEVSSSGAHSTTGKQAQGGTTASTTKNSLLSSEWQEWLAAAQKQGHYSVLPVSSVGKETAGSSSSATDPAAAPRPTLRWEWIHPAPGGAPPPDDSSGDGGTAVAGTREDKSPPAVSQGPQDLVDFYAAPTEETLLPVLDWTLDGGRVVLAIENKSSLPVELEIVKNGTLQSPAKPATLAPRAVTVFLLP